MIIPSKLLFKHGLVVGFAVGCGISFLMYLSFDYPLKTDFQKFGYYLFIALFLGSVGMSIKSGLSNGSPTFSEAKDGFIYGFILFFDVLSILFGKISPP